MEEATTFVKYFYQIFYWHITTLRYAITDKITQKINENSKIYNIIKYKQQFVSKIKTNKTSRFDLISGKIKNVILIKIYQMLFKDNVLLSYGKEIAV